jgi:hypothetical protein
VMSQDIGNSWTHVLWVQEFRRFGIGPGGLPVGW